MDKKRVLITGVSGLLGNNLALAWANKADILGLYHKHAVDLPGIKVSSADLTHTKALDKLVKEFAPDVIVHCAALADIDLCEQDHALADLLNVRIAQDVSEISQAHGVKLVHISTDAVYDGKKGNFSETSPVQPVNYYAQTKIKAEEVVGRNPKALVARTSFYGFNVQNKQCLAEWVVKELSNGKAIKGFSDVISSNIYTFDLAALLMAAIAKDLNGIYNMACNDALSKYEFALEIAKSFGLNASLVSPVSVDQFPFKAKRGKNLSLNIDKLSAAIEAGIPASKQSIKKFHEAYHRNVLERSAQ